MPSSAHDVVQSTLEDGRLRILSSLIRTCNGDFDLAEEALHDAVIAATTRWPRTGPPDAPDAWLLQTAMNERLHAVLLVIYLVFNEGYSASSGEQVVRGDLCAHAIHIGRVLLGLMPNEGEVKGLLALMLLQDSRRDARMNESGDLVLLRDQNRSSWDRAQIEEGLRLVEDLRRHPRAGSYALQAAIAAEHARATDPEQTSWKRIARLYEELIRIHPTPVIALNHAVASAMAHGAEEGLRLLDALERDLEGYGPYHAAKGDFYRALERSDDAAASFVRAIELSTNAPERRFLESRLAEIRGART